MNERNVEYELEHMLEELLQREISEKLDLSDDKQANKSTQDSFEASFDSEGEEEADLPIAPKPAAERKPRISVSAEAFGKWNKKEDFKAPEYPKSEEVKKALKARLEQAFMFSALNPDELEIVLLAMQDVHRKAGELVIKEGDEGDVLYVVETGELTCTKIFVRSIFRFLIHVLAR